MTETLSDKRKDLLKVAIKTTKPTHHRILEIFADSIEKQDKQFIKDLKEEFAQRIGPYQPNSLGFLKVIDKLAGDKLI